MADGIDRTAAIALFLSLAFATLYVRKRIGGRVSLTLLLFAGLITIHGVPLLVYVYWTGPDTFIYEAALSAVASREETLANIMFAVALMLVGVILGSEFAWAITPGWRRSAAGALSQQRGRLARVIRVTSLQRVLLSGVAIGMIAVSLSQSHPMHVLDFLSPNASIDKAALRMEAGGSPYYVYNVLLYSIAPFLVMVSWSDDIRRTGELFPSPLTWGLCIAVLLGKLGTLSKAPPVLFLLQLLLLAVLMRSDRLTLKLAVRFLLAGLVLFTGIVLLTFPESELDPSQVLAFLYYRIFDIPNEVLLEYFAAFPQSIPHGWGSSWIAKLGFSSKSELETYYAVAELWRGSIESTSNAVFIADAWAQFALVGVMLSSVVAGLVIRLIDLYAQSRGRSDLAACVTAGGAFGVFTTLTTSFTTALVTGGLALLPLLSTAFVRPLRRKKEGRV